MSALDVSNRRRKTVDRGGTILAYLAVAIALIPLGALIGFVLQRGLGAMSVDFFTKNPPPMGEPGGGVFPMIVGSALVIGMASAMGIPVGFLSGVYLSGAKASRIANLCRFVIDVIAGTPSIIAGVVVAALIVIPTTNESTLAAAIALALLMFPTVARATEAALRAVPRELHEAAVALGSPDWKALLRVAIPTAAAGLVTAMILGVARVAGETAPLYLTMGFNSFLSTNVTSGPMGSLPVQIWIDATTGLPADASRAFGGALVLFALVGLLNLLARILTYRLSKRTRLA